MDGSAPRMASSEGTSQAGIEAHRCMYLESRAPPQYAPPCEELTRPKHGHPLRPVSSWLTRARTYSRSLGARGSFSSPSRATQASEACSRHLGSPSVRTGRKSMMKWEPGSWRENSTAPTWRTARSSSSRSSRLTAERSDSPGSTFPPGNSHSPPCLLCSGRWQTRSRWSRSITAATTRTLIWGCIQDRGLFYFVVFSATGGPPLGVCSGPGEYLQGSGA